MNFDPPINSALKYQSLDTRWMAEEIMPHALYPGGVVIDDNDIKNLKATTVGAPAYLSIPSGTIFVRSKPNRYENPQWKLWKGGGARINDGTKVSDVEIGLAYNSLFDVETVREIDVVYHRAYLIYENLLPEWNDLQGENNKNMLRLIREYFHTTFYPEQFA